MGLYNSRTDSWRTSLSVDYLYVLLRYLMKVCMPPCASILVMGQILNIIIFNNLIFQKIRFSSAIFINDE